VDKELKEKQLIVQRELKEKEMQVVEKQKLLEFSEKEKVRLEERVEKEKERINEEFQAKLELNLQLEEEKRRNAQLQAELLKSKMTHTGNVSLSEERSSLLVDFGDSPLDVANAGLDTPHAPLRVEGVSKPSQYLTTSCVPPLVENQPFFSVTGVSPRRDHAYSTACVTPLTAPFLSVPTRSSSTTPTHTNQPVLAGPHILWPTSTSLPHAGALNLTDKHLQQSNHPIIMKKTAGKYELFVVTAQYHGLISWPKP